MKANINGVSNLLEYGLSHRMQRMVYISVFVGKTMEFKVVKINQEFRNVVVSHKALTYYICIS